MVVATRNLKYMGSFLQPCGGLMLNWDELRVKHQLQGTNPPPWFTAQQTEVLCDESESDIRKVKPKYRDTPQAPEEGMLCWKGTGMCRENIELIK